MITNEAIAENPFLVFSRMLDKDPSIALSVAEDYTKLLIEYTQPSRKQMDVDVQGEQMVLKKRRPNPMSKLTWHDAGTKEFEAGVKNVALYVMENGVYGEGVAWNGVTAINEAPSGADATDLYADDEKYATLRSAEKFGFTIEAYTYPDEWNECDGNFEAADGVFVGQQPRKAFGLAYITSIGDEAHPGLDKGEKLHLIYNSTASPSSRSYGTINENPDAITMSWEANATPEKVTGHKGACTIVIDSTKANSTKYNGLKDKIFGSDNQAPTLLTPDLVIAAFQ